MTTFFVDTNFFLEFKAPSDVSWAELPGQGEASIQLLVPAAVIRQLDNFKGKGNSRKARRARDASEKFREILLSPDGAIVAREKGPKVTLAFAPVMKTDPSIWLSLDPNNPDHQIIADAATYHATHGDAAVLTDDTNLVLAARAIDLPHHLIPRSWRLDVEADDRDKEIAKLREENHQLKNGRPDITLQILTLRRDDPLGELIVTLKKFSDVDGAVDRVMEKLRSMYPMVTEFSELREGGAFASQLRSTAGTLAAMGMEWEPPSLEEISEYQETQYPRWIESLRRYLDKLTSRLMRRSCIIEFGLAVTNNGFANADAVQLSIRAYDNLLLSGGDDNEENAEKMPKPPVAPTGGYGLKALKSLDNLYRTQRLMQQLRGGMDFGASPSILSIPPLAGVNRPKDRNAFYYLDHAGVGVHAELKLTCEAFPHQLPPRIFTYLLHVHEDVTVSKSRLRVHLHASNLLRPVESHANVVIQRVESDLEAELLEVIASHNRS